MSDSDAPSDDGSTPLDNEERDGLALSYVTTRGDLNAAEQANILRAEGWAFRRQRNVLDRKVLNDLHEHMFGDVWKWAGNYRRTGKNIGVAAYRIPIDLQLVFDDCAYWIEHETYSPDEIAARFHHRLVLIHPYPNGNGRHARLAADLLLRQMNRARFSWGSAAATDPRVTRRAYIDALRAADDGDYAPLLAFVRS